MTSGRRGYPKLRDSWGGVPPAEPIVPALLVNPDGPRPLIDMAPPPHEFMFIPSPDCLACSYTDRPCFICGGQGCEVWCPLCLRDSDPKSIWSGWGIEW